MACLQFNHFHHSECSVPSTSMFSKTTQEQRSRITSIHFKPTMSRAFSSVKACINISAFNLNFNSKQKQVNHPRDSTVPETTSPRHCVVHDPNESSAGSGSGGGDDGNGPSGGGGDFGGGRGENRGNSREEMLGTIMDGEETKMPSSVLNLYLDNKTEIRDLSIASSYLMLTYLMSSKEEKLNAVSKSKNMPLGVVADIGMLVPWACMDPNPSLSIASFGHLELDFVSLPSSAFEAETPGFKYALQQRIVSSSYKGILSGAVGFGCGFIYHGIVHKLMTDNRDKQKSKEDIPVFHIVKTAALWGVFYAGFSHAHYQLKQIGTVGSNIISGKGPACCIDFYSGHTIGQQCICGQQFADWAKRSGMLSVNGDSSLKIL